jgi:N-acetylglucosaminyl-diphospho-decaprenol L-rhamnosyltransferase
MATPPTAAPSSIDVVVVTYNPGETLGAFLSSLDGAGAVASVTVVDSDSPKKTAEAVARKHGSAFLAMPANLGYGAAANAGARLGAAPFIAICNSDVVVAPDAFAALAAAGGAMPTIGALGPRILEYDGSLYPSARPLPNFWLGAGHAVFGRVWPTNPWTRRYRPVLDPAGPGIDAGWLSGSCLVVRRDAFEKIGGFDEGFFMFMEDVDLGRRLGLAGYRCRWVPAAAVTHLGGHSWRSDPSPMIRAHHASAARYVGLAFPGWWRAPVRAAVRLGLRARGRAEVAAASRAKAD